MSPELELLLLKEIAKANDLGIRDTDLRKVAYEKIVDRKFIQGEKNPIEETKKVVVSSKTINQFIAYATKNRYIDDPANRGTYRITTDGWKRIHLLEIRFKKSESYPSIETVGDLVKFYSQDTPITDVGSRFENSIVIELNEKKKSKIPPAGGQPS